MCSSQPNNSQSHSNSLYSHSLSEQQVRDRFTRHYSVSVSSAISSQPWNSSNITTRPLLISADHPSSTRKQRRTANSTQYIILIASLVLIIIIIIITLWLLIFRTARPAFDVAQEYPPTTLLIRQSEAINHPTSNPLQNSTLNVLLFSAPSLDPEQTLQSVLAFLDQLLPAYSLVIVCSPRSECPGQPINRGVESSHHHHHHHLLIASLGGYAPALTADHILVLDAAFLPHTLNQAWLTSAVDLTASRGRIITAMGLSPTSLPPAMACSSRPGPASLPLPPFLLPTRRWPQNLSLIHDLSQPLPLSLVLATKLKWPSLVLPLEQLNPTYYHVSEICHESIQELSHLRSLSSQHQEQHEKPDDLDQKILQAHLEPSVGILMTESDLDESSSSFTETVEELTDWITLACNLMDKFDAEIYLVSSEDSHDVFGLEGEHLEDDEEGVLRERMRKCSRPPRPDAPIHILRPLPYYVTPSATRHPHSTLQTQLNQLVHSQPSLELLFYRLTSENPLTLPSQIHRTNSPPQNSQKQYSHNNNKNDNNDDDACVLIGLPSDQVMAADWILGLELPALKKWHQPKIDISVITNDRSRSLARLLSSLERAAYYGDRVNLVINMEQTADVETRRLVEGYAWGQGSKTVRKRIIQGGLLPAVVESWYPSSAHDSYGVLLEDDVEVSGYFYGWLKFALLWYRYSGRPAGAVYGISLYQPQHSELRPEGRRPFHAPRLLAELGVHPHTVPYASQVPCSWGALFFPETWTAFHRYLTFRLANKLPATRLDQPVIPSPIRSNRWPKSWKKYLIEWVYLRGQVMLYPNYHHLHAPSPDDHDHPLTDPAPHQEGPTLVPVGLSTNHLEIGTHVHKRPYRASKKSGKGTSSSSSLLYEQHQRAKLRLAKWGEESSDVAGSTGIGMESEERRAAQVKREFGIALKPLTRGESLLDGLTVPRTTTTSINSVWPHLPPLPALPVFDLWAEPASLQLLRERGRSAAITSPLCRPFFQYYYDPHPASPIPLNSSDLRALLNAICL
ncbi:hypothetical protein PCANC_09490 [Puccinia coronata f. sp. avenae]|uniref:Uncharacterized protein n=2 Tax=Puccinia coronata f. sp. avenae TaxID=200324 RepID=A0A2N5SBV6_9BASI|nr:hypothetical protein PCASD_20504 [Puccinia coronata f. sp. avenae]PLW54044.1 hypothetical protein PCANC_09490 [Puccinia coronata f. sp. avenae]